MTATLWLIDKSALIRLSISPARDEWFERIERGLVRIMTLTLLEIGYSARSGADLQDELHRPPLALMPIEYLHPASESRAMMVQALLAERGLHRAPSVPRSLDCRRRGAHWRNSAPCRQRLRPHRERNGAASRDAADFFRVIATQRRGRPKFSASSESA